MPAAFLIPMTDPEIRAVRHNALGQPIGFALEGWQAPPRPERTPIDGQYARLDPLDPVAHAGALWAASRLDPDGGTWTYLPVGPFSERQDFDRWLARIARGEDPLFFAIVEKQSGNAVGVASYLRITPAAGAIEIGHIWFSPALQRTLAATEAIYLMVKRVFDLGYRRCEWKCDSL